MDAHGVLLPFPTYALKYDAGKCFFQSCGVSKPSQFRDDKCICLAQTWYVFFFFFLHHKTAPALHVTAQHTQTLTHRGRRRIQRVQLYLWLVKRFILCSSRPLASKKGGSDWRDSISWVGSRSLHGRRREEEIKLLAFVGGLGIKHGGGASCEENTSQPVCECMRVSRGCRWSGRSGHPL